MLRRLSEFIEKNVRMMSKVRQAMIYPVGILIFAVVVTIFMLWKVIPIFATIFRDLGAELPWLTAGVVAMSDFVQKYIILVIAGLFGLVLAFRYYRSTKQGRWSTDTLLLKIPLFGNLLYKVAMTRVTRTLATPHRRRRAYARGAEITSTTAGNVIIESEIVEARKLVSEGKTLSVPSRVGEVPDDDAPDDQRRRGHGHARRNAEQAGHLL